MFIFREGQLSTSTNRAMYTWKQVVLEMPNKVLQAKQGELQRAVSDQMSQTFVAGSLTPRQPWTKVQWFILILCDDIGQFRIHRFKWLSRLWVMSNLVCRHGNIQGLESLCTAVYLARALGHVCQLVSKLIFVWLIAIPGFYALMREFSLAPISAVRHRYICTCENKINWDAQFELNTSLSSQSLWYLVHNPRGHVIYIFSNWMFVGIVRLAVAKM